MRGWGREVAELEEGRERPYEGGTPATTKTYPHHPRPSPRSVSSDANRPPPSVLGWGPSQCRRAAVLACASLLGHGGRPWGVYKPWAGAGVLTVSIPSPRCSSLSLEVMPLLVMLSL
ncbi:hypothetical protein K523DRAFT_15418 [Schizophyllum commune Tattone D]|nr:hypothetical protein K523DRAFT_15418 [Schizophyllum commune Tattone D]